MRSLCSATARGWSLLKKAEAKVEWDGAEPFALLLSLTSTLIFSPVRWLQRLQFTYYNIF